LKPSVGDAAFNRPLLRPEHRNPGSRELPLPAPIWSGPKIFIFFRFDGRNIWLRHAVRHRSGSASVHVRTRKRGGRLTS
jgi:hypothetical protein